MERMLARIMHSIRSIIRCEGRIDVVGKQPFVLDILEAETAK